MLTGQVARRQQQVYLPCEKLFQASWSHQKLQVECGAEYFVQPALGSVLAFFPHDGCAISQCTFQQRHSCEAGSFRHLHKIFARQLQLFFK